MKKYKVYYSEDFGENYVEEEKIKTKNIFCYMEKFSEELSYPTHEWLFDEEELTVSDNYGNVYKFEEVKE